CYVSLDVDRSRQSAGSEFNGLLSHLGAVPRALCILKLTAGSSRASVPRVLWSGPRFAYGVPDPVVLAQRDGSDARWRTVDLPSPAATGDEVNRDLPGEAAAYARRDSTFSIRRLALPVQATVEAAARAVAPRRRRSV